MGGSSIDGRTIRDALIDRYTATRRFAAVVADSDLDPDDLVQEAYARVLRSVERREVTVEALDAYLRSTLMRIIANERRSRSRGRAALDRVRPIELVDAEYPSHTAAMLDAATPIDRALVFLVDVERLPTAEAGAAVGLSPDATRARLSRARRALRDSLREEER